MSSYVLGGTVSVMRFAPNSSRGLTPGIVGKEAVLLFSVDYKRLVFPFAIEEFLLPAASAAAAQAAGEPHDIRNAEEAWPMPLSAPLVAGPDWGRERTREARRG
jgi:hypothetical protein